MIITNSRYALVGYFITSYPTRAHGIIVIYSNYGREIRNFFVQPCSNRIRKWYGAYHFTRAFQTKNIDTWCESLFENVFLKLEGHWLVPSRLSVCEGSGSQLGETTEAREDGKEERRKGKERDSPFRFLITTCPRIPYTRSRPRIPLLK